jgi:T3SS negative regulator,GrlR
LERVLEIAGLWTVKFSLGVATGSGVITLVDGRIFGGDSSYYYSGSYAPLKELNSVTGLLRVIHFYGPLSNVFGPYRELQLSFVGSVGNDLIIANARSASAPHLNLSVRLDRVERFEEKS